MTKKIYCALIISITIVISLVIPVNAATGYQGHAIYRDGVGSGGISLFWHAGLMDQPYADTWYYNSECVWNNNDVMQHCGTGFAALAQFDDFTNSTQGKNFMGSVGINPGDPGYVRNNFEGVYRPWGTVTSQTRDSVVATGKLLATYNIPYTLYGEMDYDVVNSGYVYAGDIKSIRCDGVVEYCYEFHGIQVSGAGWPTSWDIAQNRTDTYISHWGIKVTPETQAGDMYKITTNKPYSYK